MFCGHSLLRLQGYDRFSHQTQDKIYLKFLGLLCVLENLANGRNKPAFYWLSVKSSQVLLRVSGMCLGLVLLFLLVLGLRWLGWCRLVFL